MSTNRATGASLIRLLPLVLVACSAYGPETPLADLDDEARLAICEGSYGVGGDVLEDCGLVIPVRVGALDAAACASTWFPEACDATVAEWEACQASIAADACTLQVGSDACAPLEACGLHLWSAALGLDGGLGLTSMGEFEIITVCEVTNDYEAFSIPCEDGPPVDFQPIPETCIGFGFGGCGTLSQVLDCQVDILNYGDAVCEGLPESCVFADCV